jgi:SecD/SecF fusion protein
MKFLSTYAAACCFPLMLILFSSCGGDTPLEHGIEYTLSVPAGTDDLVTARAAAVLNARLEAFGLDQSDFDVVNQAGSIKVRVAEGTIKDESKFRKVILRSANLSFRAMYDLAEISSAMDQARLAYNRVSGLDSMQIVTEPGFWKYLTPAYNFSESGPVGSMPIIFYCQAKDTAAVNRILAMDSVHACFPSDMVFMWGNGTVDANGENRLSLLACKVGSNYELSGEHVTNAQLVDSPDGGSPQVSITFDITGAEKWAKMTKANIGRCIAIEVDGFVYSYPNVQGEITGGLAQISGPEAEDMENLAHLLNSGKMPVRLSLVSKGTF